jgi:hypothetical protein
MTQHGGVHYTKASLGKCFTQHYHKSLNTESSKAENGGSSALENLDTQWRHLVVQRANLTCSQPGRL